MSDEYDDRDALRDLFGDSEQPPRDVVAPTGLTRADLERQSAAYLKPVHGTVPGEVLTDSEGNLLGVAESRTVSAIFGGTAISRAEADCLGIAPGELPGVHVIETKENQR
jgi:hypothetical protein